MPPGGGVVIHFNDGQELFDIEDFNNTTVSGLLKCAQIRFYDDYEDVLVHPSDCLCEGPYAIKAIDDIRFHAIVQMLQEPITPESDNQEPGVMQESVHLWFCNYLNNRFLSENIPTTARQQHLGDTAPADKSGIFEDISLRSTYSEPGAPPQLEVDTELVQIMSSQHEELIKLLEAPDAYLESLEKALESCDTSDESSDDNVLKFTNSFRNEQKKKYRTDVFPLKKNSKAKKSKSTSTKVTAQMVNKKRKTYKKSKKYAFHLQAVKSTRACRGSKYPRLRLTRHYLDLLKKGEPVSVYVAVVKYMNGRRCLDALKGYLINKKDPKIPLENPCVLTFKWTDKKNPPPKDYPLKLALIQVSGDINRKSKVEFNETFNLALRTVDETSKYSDYNTTIDTHEPDEFQIAVVPAKDVTVSEADWSMLIESGTIHYTIGKSNKKQKTNSSTASSLVSGLRQTTQEYEGDDDDDEQEEEEEENDGEDYDDDDEDDEDYDDEE